MKLQRNTIALVATALLLGGVVLLTESRQPSANNADPTSASHPNNQARPVFDFKEANVVGLHIETQGQAVTFKRNIDGFWQMVEPEKHPAEEAAIAFLLSRLVTDGLVNTTTADAAKQADFGLDVPFATVDLTLQDGTQHVLVLGTADFSGNHYYALIDPPRIPLPQNAGTVEIAILSENIRNGVDRPLAEWQAPLDATDTSQTDAPDAKINPEDAVDDSAPATSTNSSESEPESSATIDSSSDQQPPPNP